MVVSYVGTDTSVAKGRTNIELREQFILADGVSQSMAAFKPRVSNAGSSHQGSPSPGPGPIMKVIDKSSTLRPKKATNQRQITIKLIDLLLLSLYCLWSGVLLWFQNWATQSFEIILIIHT